MPNLGPILLLSILCSGAICPSHGAESFELIPFNAWWQFKESEVDLEEFWRQPDYVDGRWISGQGAFATSRSRFLKAPIPLGTELFDGKRPPPTRIVCYFRTHFLWTNQIYTTVLVASNFMHEAGIVYLNGAEAARDRVLSGSGLGAKLDPSPDFRPPGTRTLRLSATNLVQGKNVLAVELLQRRPLRADPVFAFNLWAEVFSAGEPAVLHQPTSRMLFAPAPLELEAEVLGIPPLALQWRKDNVPIPGATGPLYRVERCAPEDAGKYTLAASNAMGQVLTEEVLVSIAPPGLVPFHHVWKFRSESGFRPAEDWRSLEYDDSAWRSGPAPIGASMESDESFPQRILTRSQPTVGLGADMIPVTTFLRTQFLWSNAPVAMELYLTSMFDDGGIVYLNGEEILRLRLQPGPLDFLTYATRRVGTPFLETNTVPGANLQPGTNQLAVEVHQVTAGSGDLAFALRLDALPASSMAMGAGRGAKAVTNLSGRINAPPNTAGKPRLPAVSLITFTNDWWHLQGDNSPPDGWMQGRANGSGWALGAGIFVAGSAPSLDVPAATEGTTLELPVTRVWFAAPFTLNTGEERRRLWLRHIVDDGAVVYLNGKEALRINVPHGALTDTRRARSRVHTPSLGGPIELSPDFIRPGTNWIAVELRPCLGSDSDLAFGLELTAELPPKPQNP